MVQQLEKWMWRTALWQIGAVTATWAALPLAAWAILPSRTVERWVGNLPLFIWFYLALGGTMIAVLLIMLSGYLVERTRFYFVVKRVWRPGRHYWRRECWWSFELWAGTVAVALICFGVGFGWILAAGATWVVCGIVARWVALRDTGWRGVRPSRMVMVIGGVILALPLLSYGVLIGLTRIEEKRTADGLAALGKAGYCTSAGDLAAYYAPVERDGAPVVDQLVAWREANKNGTWKEGGALLARGKEPWPPAGAPMYREIREFFAAHSGYTALVDELMSFDQVRYRRNWAEMMQIDYSELNALRAVAQFGRLQMLAAWEAKDSAEALRLWQGMGKIRQQLLEDPLLISGMVGRSVESIRLSALNEGMNLFGALSDAQLRAIIADIDIPEEENRRSLLGGLQSEMVFMLQTPAQKGIDRHAMWFLWLPPERVMPQFGSLPLIREWVVSVERNNFVTVITRMLHAVESGKESLADIENETEQLSALQQGGLITVGAISVHERWLDVVTALQRATKALAAAELYYRQHGAFPERLEQLVEAGLLSAVPLDPFNHEPMRCRLISPLELQVYSVGSNRQDDGGDCDHRKISSGKDIGFALKLPHL